MRFEVILNIIWMSGIGLMLLLKPHWLLKLVLRPNSPKTKVNALKKVIQFLGIIILVLTVVSIIRSLFNVIQ